MTTLVRRYPGVVGQTLLGTYQVSEDELALLAAPDLVDWWDPDFGISGAGGTFKWVGRKASRRLVPFRAAAPMRVPDVFGDLSSIRTGLLSANGELYDPDGHAMYPINASYSFAFIVRNTTADSVGVVVGNGATAAAGRSALAVRGTDGKFNFSQGGVGLTSSGGPLTNSVAHLVVASYDFAAKRIWSRVDGAPLHVNVPMTTENNNAEMHLFACGDAATQSNSLDNADVGIVMIFAAPIANGAFPELLALVESYLMGKRGV